VAVPTLLIVRELVLLASDGRQKPILLNERQQRNALPGHFLSVHIDIKVFRIEVNDRRVIICHQGMERLGKMCFTEMQWRSVRMAYDLLQSGLPCSREHSHQLLERLKRRSNVEFDIVLLDVVHIRSKRRIVVWVEPLPRRCLYVQESS
jgi:hypothetical protein